MKAILGICVAMGLLAYFLTLGAGCYPHDPPPRPCPANDRSCLPCPNPQTTDPSCMPWILDAKHPDAGVAK